MIIKNKQYYNLENGSQSSSLESEFAKFAKDLNKKEIADAKIKKIQAQEIAQLRQERSNMEKIQEIQLNHQATIDISDFEKDHAINIREVSRRSIGFIESNRSGSDEFTSGNITIKVSKLPEEIYRITKTDEYLGDLPESSEYYSKEDAVDSLESF